MREIVDVSIPKALHNLHTTRSPGDVVELLFGTNPSRQRIADVLEGAGFETLKITSHGAGAQVESQVLPTLPDTVSSKMRMLLVGLNPSLHSVEAGYGFAGPGNHFWPAGTEAGLVSKDRDPLHALKRHQIGMSDLVKRASTKASAISDVEYQAGVARLDRLCGWLSPGIVCVLGITGWRSALNNRNLRLGRQTTQLGGRTVYVLPNPSGLNAHTNHADLVQCFKELLKIADISAS